MIVEVGETMVSIVFIVDLLRMVDMNESEEVAESNYRKKKKKS